MKNGRKLMGKRKGVRTEKLFCKAVLLIGYDDKS